MLASNVVIQSDGGGKVLAFINPIAGVERVLRLYRNLHRKFGNDGARLVRPIRIDGLPGYISHERGDVIQTTAFAIEDGLITNIYITRNPDKLHHVVELLSDKDGTTGRTQ
jgi:RNA polymerase sigma-70 factor (ECF subfamily)